MKQRVAAAIIKCDGLLFVCRRPAHKRHGNLWEFPGGKIEPGETLACAVIRELAEELALEVTAVGAVLFEVTDADSGYTIQFVSVDTCGEVKLLEHSECAWLNLDQLIELSLAPSDRLFVEHLRQQQGKSALAQDTAPGHANPDAIR